MKASWLALASLVSIASAHAGEIASPSGAKIGETAISRMYRVVWLAKFARQQTKLQSAPAAHTRLHPIANAPNAALEHVAAAKEALDARISAIAAQVDDEMQAIAAGRPLRYRVHIDCSSKSVAAARPPEGPGSPVLAAFGPDVTSVNVSLESCVIKIRWKFLDEDGAPKMRAYSVSLPLEAAAE